MKKNDVLIYLLSFIIGGILILIGFVLKDGLSFKTYNIPSSKKIEDTFLNKESLLNNNLSVKNTNGKQILANVPFTSQAPFGNWNNLMYKEGCEEASIIMAVYWVRGDILTPDLSNTEIKNISNYELKLFGNYINTSIQDTAKVLQEYYSFDNFKIVNNLSKNDIITSLSKGNILLIPAYGRGLRNKNYTPPGPVAHMLVITGYDQQKKEFITNDPGTKHGKGYRYNEDVLFNAIWSYPTSSKNLLPPKAETIKKSMIEIYK